MKAPGIHCYVAGSIPAVTHRYCTKKIEKNALWSTKKTKKGKNNGNDDDCWMSRVVKNVNGRCGEGF
jgi:hypothetical protein